MFLKLLSKVHIKVFIVLYSHLGGSVDYSTCMVHAFFKSLKKACMIDVEHSA